MSEPTLDLGEIEQRPWRLGYGADAKDDIRVLIAKLREARRLLERAPIADGHGDFWCRVNEFLASVTDSWERE